MTYSPAEFAQVGNDQKATRFLEELDNHPQVGGLIDCTSNFELEQAEMSRKSGIDLTPEMWLVKLLMSVFLRSNLCVWLTM